jgi:hypothetical protein
MSIRGNPGAPVVRSLPSYTGYLGMFDHKKNWLPRLVVIRDNQVPIISIYDAASPLPPNEDMLIQQIPLTGYVDVGDFYDMPDLAGRLTLKKPQLRPNAFTLFVNEKNYGFEATSVENRLKWIEHIMVFINKYKLDKNPAPTKYAAGTVRKKPSEMTADPATSAANV